MTDGLYFAIAAGFTGSVVLTVPISLYARRAMKAQAVEVKVAREDAARARDTSQRAALDLISLSREHSDKLAEIARETRHVHDIVNHRTTALQRRTAYLARRVASDHPEDAEAQQEAMRAEGDASASQARQDAMERQDQQALSMVEART
jgi:hypothetical protein